MSRTAEEVRIALRQMIIDRDSQNVTGVGTERGPGNQAPEKLVVWYRGDLEQARLFVHKMVGEHLDFPVEWVKSRSRGFRVVEQVEQVSIRSIMSGDSAFMASSPASATFNMQDEILPTMGQGGRPSCFIKLPDGSTPVLTANHLFTWRTTVEPKATVFVLDQFMPKPQRIGHAMAFGQLGSTVGTASKADCALFVADTEAPFRDGHLSGGFVHNADIGDTMQRKAHTLMPAAEAGDGIIVAANHTITIPINQGMANGSIVMTDCVFDNQIYIINTTNVAFGIDGHSGSLAIMKEDGATVRVGDALGIYMGGDDTNTYHLVSPFEACLIGLGQKGATVF